MFSPRIGLCTIVALLLATQSVNAQTYSYTWGGSPGPLASWENGGNWVNVTGNPTELYPNNVQTRAFFNNTIYTAVSLGSTASLQILEFGASATSYTFSGAGTISFTNAGTGTILLNSGASAQAINTGITLNGALAVTNNSSNATAFGGTITGTSQTLTLTSAQATTFSGNVSLGSLVKNGAGTLTFSGSTVAITTGLTINAGLVNFNNTATSTIAGSITGAGNLAKNSASTTTLTGGNSYSGTTTITTGTLQVGNGGTTGTLGSGAVTNNSELVFNRSDAFSVANNISGSGNLTTSGAGTLIYTGAGTYNGTTTINSGTLQVGNGGATGTLGSGAVTNNSQLIFNRSNATTVANALSGSGSLTKTGAGTLSYTGTASYTGTTAINAGTLSIDTATGNLNNAVGTVSVNNGGTLAGTDGTIARNITVNSGGVIRGGDVGTIGTLNVTGATTVLGAASNGGQITIRTDGATSSGAGTNLDPFVLSSNSLLALGANGTLNLDPAVVGGKFRFLIENDASLAQFTTYRLVVATANGSTQFQRAGDGSAAFTAADFEVYGQSSANPFTDIKLSRTTDTLILTFVTVPEPSLMLGLGAGVLGLGAFLRKRFA